MYTTPPPPSNQQHQRVPPNPTPAPEPSNGGSNFLVIALVGGVVAGGTYWYFSPSGTADDLKRRTKADEALAKQKAHELSDAGKARANDAIKQGQEKYSELKVSI